MKPDSKQIVFTLLVEVGRSANDGLPKGSTGAAILCYATGVDEAEAVRETVALLKRADMAPLDVTSYGSRKDQIADGVELSQDDITLMDRALDENAVIVVKVEPFFSD